MIWVDGIFEPSILPCPVSGQLDSLGGGLVWERRQFTNRKTHANQQFIYHIVEQLYTYYTSCMDFYGYAAMPFCQFFIIFQQATESPMKCIFQVNKETSPYPNQAKRKLILPSFRGRICWVSPPPRIPMTTRIITIFKIEDPKLKPSLAFGILTKRGHTQGI